MKNLLNVRSFFVLVLICAASITSYAKGNSGNPMVDPFSSTIESTDHQKTQSKQETRKEKKAAKKELKKKLKEKMKMGADEMTILLVILALLLPPLAVYLAKDGISTAFWINIILTLLFWLPGVIHALIVVLTE